MAQGIKGTKKPIKVVGVRLFTNIYEMIKSSADVENINVSDMVRLIINKYYFNKNL